LGGRCSYTVTISVVYERLAQWVITLRSVELKGFVFNVLEKEDG